MKRVKQESSEVYEVTATEVATALGVLMCDEDQVTFEYRYGDLYRITVKATTDEDVEVAVPVPLDGEAIALGFLTPVLVPPFDQFGPGIEPITPFGLTDIDPLPGEVEAV